MINVLILIPDQLRRPMGGMGEQAKNILACFPSAYKFDVIGSQDGAEYQTKNISFYPVMYLQNINGTPEPIGETFLSQALFIEKALSLKTKPDIIHAFDWSTFYAGRILSKHFNAPLVVTIQLSIEKHITEIHPGQQLQYNTACSMEMAGLIEADAIIQVSENYAALFQRFLLPKTTVIHNGINLKEWQPDGDAKFPGTNKLKVVYIGRYAEMKNIKALLRCKLPAEMDLIFIGDERGGNPDLFNEMIMYCANNKNAFYIGPKYGQEKINLLNASDAVIIPSIHEPFGIVALEALASKSVLLSSFVNGMADFLTDESAINCGTTPESIETALNTLIKLTDSQKSKYINAGLKVCQAHAWEIQAEKMAKVYDSVLN